MSNTAFGTATLQSWFQGSSTTKRSTPTKPRSRPGSIANFNGTCRVTNSECANSKSRVKIDMTAQCMCVDSDCFRISIGSRGPNVTRNGTSTIGRAMGTRYRSNNITPPTIGYDNDAVSMGIPQNDSGAGIRDITSGGKWIHKTGSCAPATSYSTWGCVGVQCNDWPKVKNCVGCSLTVCGGASSDSQVISNKTGRDRSGKYHPVQTQQQRASLRRNSGSEGGAIQ